MDNVIELNRRRVFTKQEAQELLPVVHRITTQYYKRVQVLLNRLESIKGKSEKVVQELESEINGIVQEWQQKMEKLGAQTKGLWIADFDSGDGYFCWKYPEAKIDFWHRYSDGFSGRVRLDDVESQPDLQL